MTTAVQAFHYCANELRRNDRMRFLTTLAAPAQRRGFLLALYAFNLELAKAAEVTAESTLSEIRLEWWRQAIADLYAGRTREHMVVRALAETAEAAGVVRRDLDEMISIRDLDLVDEPFADLEAMNGHAACGAGHLSRLAISVLEPKLYELERAAEDVGAAWALLGLIRSLGHWGASRRLALPLRELMAAGLQPEDIFRQRHSEPLAALIGEVLGLARERLGRARRLAPKPPRSALSPLLLAPIAERYIGRLEISGRNPFSADFNLGQLLPPCLIGWHFLSGRF